MKNKLFEKAFKHMEHIGWNIEDFDKVLDMHLTTMFLLAEEERKDGLDHMAQFMLDFLVGLDYVSKT